jgi:hypothetical protein
MESGQWLIEPVLEPRRAVLVAGTTLSIVSSSARSNASEAASMRSGRVVLLGDSVFR